MLSERQKEYVYSERNLFRLKQNAFKIGHPTWNKGREYLPPEIRARCGFKKGQKIALGIKRPDVSEKNKLRRGKNWNSNYELGATCYRRKAKNLKQECNICHSIKQLVVHHKNTDHQDNRLENLEILCISCHVREHSILGEMRGYI